MDFIIISLVCSTSAAMMLDQFSIHHGAPSAAEPQPKESEYFAQRRKGAKEEGIVISTEGRNLS